MKEQFSDPYSDPSFGRPSLEDLNLDGPIDPGYYPPAEKAVEPVVEEFKPLDADNPNFGQVKEEDWDQEPTN